MKRLAKEAIALLIALAIGFVYLPVILWRIFDGSFLEGYHEFVADLAGGEGVFIAWIFALLPYIILWCIRGLIAAVRIRNRQKNPDLHNNRKQCTGEELAGH